MPRQSPSSRPAPVRATAVGLFCGAGGLTHGLLDAGVSVAAGYDVDEACRFPYEHNNAGAKFEPTSVAELTAATLTAHYPAGHTRILVGCAPCQTFSKYTQGLDNDDDPKWTLLDEFARLVREVELDIVSMENVPELQRHPIFDRFLSMLSDEGFYFTEEREKQIVCALKRLGFTLDRQRGSHAILKKRMPNGEIGCVIPMHREIAAGTLRSALKMAGIEFEEFAAAL